MVSALIPSQKQKNFWQIMGSVPMQYYEEFDPLLNWKFEQFHWTTKHWKWYTLYQKSSAKIKVSMWQHWSLHRCRRIFSKLWDQCPCNIMGYLTPYYIENLGQFHWKTTKHWKWYTPYWKASAKMRVTVKFLHSKVKSNIL